MKRRSALSTRSWSNCEDAKAESMRRGMRMVTGPAGASTRARNRSSYLGRSDGLEPSGNSDANSLSKASAVSTVCSVVCIRRALDVAWGKEKGRTPGERSGPTGARGGVRSVKLVASVAAGLRGYDAEHQGADAERDVLAGIVMLVPAVGV